MARSFTSNRINSPGIYQVLTYEGQELVDDSTVEVRQVYKSWPGNLVWNMPDLIDSVTECYDGYYPELTFMQRKMRDIKHPYIFDNKEDAEEYKKSKGFK